MLQCTPSLHSFDDVKVTMAYSDYPADTSSANVLVNDVDLVVSNEANSTWVYPNEWVSSRKVRRRRTDGDRYNNVEVTKLSENDLEDLCGDEPATILVHVRRHLLSTKYQPVSIVITGDFRFDAVEVFDDTSLDYKDEPTSQSSDWKGTALQVFVYIGVAVLVGVM